MYEPGTYPPISPNLKFEGRVRLLDSDEYLYYRSFLTKEDESIIIKAGIAKVLKNDTVMLFKSNYDIYLDPIVRDWADYYASLSGEALNLANTEVYYFLTWLSESSAMPVIDNVGAGLSEVISTNFKNKIKIRIYQEEVVRKNNSLTNEALSDSKSKAEKAKKKIDEINDELLKTDPSLLERKEQFIRTNIVDYLAGYFVRHPISLMADGMKSDLEFDLRKEVINAVRYSAAKPTTAIAYYITNLDLIYVANSEKHYYKMKSELEKPGLGHPLSRLLVQGLRHE